MYWGPGPLLFIWPFYMLGGVGREDVFYTLIAGLLNIVLFFLVMNTYIRYFGLSLSYFSRMFLLLSFAFASPNFYLTLTPGIWSTYQVIAITYLLLFLLFYCLMLMNKQRRLTYLAVGVVFFTLAWLSRYTLVFYGLLFLYPFYLFYKAGGKVLLCKAVGIFVGITVIFGSLFGLYNYHRFGDPFETGFRYQVGKERSNKALREGKVYSIDYMPHNITHYFLNHAALTLEKKPFFSNLTLEGNSIFSVYPAVLLFFFLFQKKYFQKKTHMFFIVSAVTIIVGTLTYFSVFFASGWDQLGNRFFFDLIPLVFVLLLFVLKEIPVVVKAVLLGYGIVINMIGLLAFIYTLQGGK